MSSISINQWSRVEKFENIYWKLQPRIKGKEHYTVLKFPIKVFKFLDSTPGSFNPRLYDDDDCFYYFQK